jgi:hypothetical protein
MFFIVGCATSPGKISIRYAESIDWNLDLTISGEDYGFLLYKNDINVIRINDEQQTDNRLIFAPGLYMLEIQYFRTASAAGGGQWLSQSEIVPVMFNVEKGKIYFLDYEIANNTINFNIKDKSTDPHTIEQIEEARINLINRVEEQRNKRNEFLAFSKSNPDYLVGAWYYENSYPPFNNTVTFQKDRFTITSFNRWGKSERLTSGRYVFNNETIILFYEDYEKMLGKTASDKEILYYELKNNFLNILDAPQSMAILTFGSLRGKYINK